MLASVVCRRRPDRALIRATLLRKVRVCERKWRAIERAGEPLLVGAYVQCAGARAQELASSCAGTRATASCPSRHGPPV
jgi:endonuclease V-like protein UPF0215 family